MATEKVGSRRMMRMLPFVLTSMQVVSNDTVWEIAFFG